MRYLNAISLRKAKAIICSDEFDMNLVEPNRQLGVQIQAEIMKLGYMLSEEALAYLTLNPNEVEDVLKTLSKLTGADKSWKPFYPNFPQQVKELDDADLFWNAILHYFSNGEWQPKYKAKNNYPIFEEVNFKEICLMRKTNWLRLFSSILKSNGSLTSLDKEVVETTFAKVMFFPKAAIQVFTPSEIPFKETMAMYVTLCSKNGYIDLAQSMCKTPTDVLRVAAGMSGFDTSLTETVRFKLKTSQKTFLVKLLDKFDFGKLENDIARRPEVWKRLFSTISSKVKSKTLKAIAETCYNGLCESRESWFQAALLKDNFELAMRILSPGEFARKLDYLLSQTPSLTSQEIIVNKFLKVAPEVDNKVLYQVLAHFSYRNQTHPRIAIPMKGRAYTLPKKENLPFEILNLIIEGIDDILLQKSKHDLGKVWINPLLTNVPIPLQMRNADDNIRMLSRGTRLPLGSDKPIIRFFDHWGRTSYNPGIIDLHVYSYNENFTKQMGYVCWDNLKAPAMTHSGDQLKLNNGGCCQFIDVNLDEVDADYLVMEMRVYSGNDFESQEAFCGWMMRSEDAAQEGATFDPKTVEMAFHLTRCKKDSMVAMIDVKRREFVWMEVEGMPTPYSDIRHDEPAKTQAIDFIMKYKQMTLPSLYNLFWHHAKGNVVDREDADTVFDIDWAERHTEVLSEYL